MEGERAGSSKEARDGKTCCWEQGSVNRTTEIHNLQKRRKDLTQQDSNARSGREGQGGSGSKMAKSWKRSTASEQLNKLEKPLRMCWRNRRYNSPKTAWTTRRDAYQESEVHFEDSDQLWRKPTGVAHTASGKWRLATTAMTMATALATAAITIAPAQQVFTMWRCWAWFQSQKTTEGLLRLQRPPSDMFGSWNPSESVRWRKTTDCVQASAVRKLQINESVEQHVTADDRPQRYALDFSDGLGRRTWWLLLRTRDSTALTEPSLSRTRGSWSRTVLDPWANNNLWIAIRWILVVMQVRQTTFKTNATFTDGSYKYIAAAGIDGDVTRYTAVLDGSLDEAMSVHRHEGKSATCHLVHGGTGNNNKRNESWSLQLTTAPKVSPAIERWI